MRQKEFGSLIKFEKGGASIIIDCESERVRRQMQAAVDGIVASPQFRAAEAYRARYERAKSLHQYDKTRLLKYHADCMYRTCRSKIKSMYLESRHVDEEDPYIDITPFGILLDEIDFAIESLDSLY